MRFSYIAKSAEHFGSYMAVSTVSQAVVNLLGLQLLRVKWELAALTLALPGWLLCQAWSCAEKGSQVAFQAALRRPGNVAMGQRRGGG